MKNNLKLLKAYLREAVLMTTVTSPSAPTDTDAAVPGHLPNELPKSAFLEDDVLDEEAWVPGRWFPNGYEPEPYDHERVGDPLGMPSGAEADDLDELDETDDHYEGDGMGNGIPDPNEEGDDKMADHLRDNDRTCLGSPPEEKPTRSFYDELDEAAYLNRDINRYLLQEYPVGAGMVDPIEEPHGFYTPFDMERDHEVDIHGYWYASPGRAAGQDGDPRRPADPYVWLGMHSPVGPDDSTTPPEASGEEGVASRKAPPIDALDAGDDTGKVLGATQGPETKTSGLGT